jgi:hypothetical protein
MYSLREVSVEGYLCMMNLAEWGSDHCLNAISGHLPSRIETSKNIPSLGWDSKPKLWSAKH